KMTIEESPKCPSCKKPVEANTPMGLCPECLVRSGFFTGAAPSQPEPRRRRFQAPDIDELRPLFSQLDIESLIGAGGMGAVYKARQHLLDRPVALKILARDDNEDGHFSERFQREAQALAKLNHPNIVTVYDFGQAGEHHYLIME